MAPSKYTKTLSHIKYEVSVYTLWQVTCSFKNKWNSRWHWRWRHTIHYYIFGIMPNVSVIGVMWFDCDHEIKQKNDYPSVLANWISSVHMCLLPEIDGFAYWLLVCAQQPRGWICVHQPLISWLMPFLCINIQQKSW